MDKDEELKLYRRAFRVLEYWYSGSEVATLAYEILQGETKMLKTMEVDLPRNMIDNNSN